MSIHWEGGKCVTDTQEINRLVLDFPEYESFTVSIFRDHLRGIHDRIRSATQSHYNRRSARYICPFGDCKDEFETMALLDTHLKSPWHDVEAFRCPSSSCEINASSLSGLLQHIELSSCDEGIDIGTGCFGRLLKFLLKEFGMDAEAPTADDFSDSLL